MAIVSIAGVTRGIGKTAVAEFLLGRFEGWHAARVRVADEIPETIAAQIGDEGYLLVAEADDAEARRLLDAGAVSAAVLLAKPRGLEAGLDALLAALPQDANVLIEGNAFLWARRADFALMVIGPGPSGKGLAPVRPATRELFGKIDLWTWNTRGDPAAEGFFEFPQALVRMGFRGSVSNRADFHHINPRARDHSGNRTFLDTLRRHIQHLGIWRESDAFLRRIGFDTPDEGGRDG
jgi:hypothetical protein